MELNSVTVYYFHLMYLELVLLRKDFKEMEGRCGLDSSGSEHGPMASSCEHGNKASGSIKGEEFLDQLSH
jgi:hypothetical protein